MAHMTLTVVRIGEFITQNINATISGKANLRLVGLSVLKQGLCPSR